MATTNQTFRDPRHVESIDVIRGLAALSVALLHIREVSWIGMRAYWQAHGIDVSLSSLFAYLTFPFVWGSIGVPIFFVISGYVIHAGSWNKVESLAQARTFWLRRFIRIYPTFIAAMLITLSCDTISSTYGTHEKLGDLSVGNAVLNLLALVGIVGSPYGSNGALWSLAIEIQFYAVYPLALIVWRHLSPLRMLGATLALSLAGYLVFSRNGIENFATYYFSWWLGAYLADVKGKSTAGPGWLAAAAAALMLGCALLVAQWPIATHMAWSVSFAMLLHYLLNQVSRTQPSTGTSLLLQKTLRKFGDFSYSLYAVHLPIAVAFDVYFLNGEKQNSIGWVAVILLLAVATAYLVYLAVEVPSIRLLKKLSRSLAP